MNIVAKMDEFGMPAWITAMVVGFIVFWPIGLAVLAYLIWSGRMGSWKCGGRKVRSMRRSQRPTGNTAFDEYREATLQRLEDEQKEFQSFLDRLRAAKDREEFEQFMRDRRRGEDKPGDAGAAGEPSPAH